RWSLDLLKHLLRIGVPIFIVGQVYALWAVMDRTLVLRLAGTEAMGLYTIAFQAGMAMDIVPAAVSQVVYPRMAQEYGRTGSPTGLIRITLKPMLLSAVALTLVATVAWLLMESLVRAIMPAYLEAVPALRWTLPLGVILCFGSANNLFNVVRRQGLYLGAMLAGIAAYGVSLALMVQGGVYLSAFPQAMIVGRVVFQLVAYIFLWRLLRPR
ncbi:MAG: oligosaccharide flippase family protein, partial [Armatimonadetes bacterium]|nr:oligosaccharide flippase family protein [Armatimonadota bacterium]